MVIDQILAVKRAEVAGRRPAGWKPPENLLCSDRSFEDALRRPGTGFIFECKKASPSRGLIRSDFDPAAIARVYAGSADAISVLTDETFFAGHLNFVTAVRNAVSLPVLCKDFVVDPFQVYEARAHGADAILLMMCVLDDAAFVQCFSAAASLSMDALVEVHSEEELRRAVALGARIIGINNRDFKDLSVNLDTTRRLAPLVPRDRVVVAESGITDHRDVAALRHLVDGFLVGSSLMEQADLPAAVKALVHGRVKVCGLTRREDARMAAELGACYGGLIFVSSSRRSVSLNTAGEVSGGIPLRWVGVFADAPAEMICDAAAALCLHAVQLHGKEDDRYIETLRQRLGHCEIWKAVSVDGCVPALSRSADRILFDAGRGGSGVAFDWTLLEGQNLSQCFLAGGLNAQNAAAADRLGAFGLDVNSGVESSPGVKDHHRLNTFMQVLRGRGKERTE
jgi:indole-3-glycerol phosphate synthase/phosphoribosylanthranilate isomerase